MVFLHIIDRNNVKLIGKFSVYEYFFYLFLFYLYYTRITELRVVTTILPFSVQIVYNLLRATPTRV